MHPSAMPTSKQREGNSFWKETREVPSSMPAVKATRRSSRRAASVNAPENASLHERPRGEESAFGEKP